MQVQIPICKKCSNFYGYTMNCRAFDKIPDEILTGENDHSKPLPDQKNDIVFELIKMA